jgi:hypothetical protein
MALPTLTPEARAAALAKAAEARKARSELKSSLKMGSLSLAEVLKQAESNDVVGKTKVLAVLESLPGVGKVKARRTLEEIGIADNRTLRGIGEQQKAKLLEAFASEA